MQAKRDPFFGLIRASLQIIYRIYFAMPKIPEIASQHKLCIAKKSKAVTTHLDSFAGSPIRAAGRIGPHAGYKFITTFIKRSSWPVAGGDLKMLRDRKKIRALVASQVVRTGPP